MKSGWISIALVIIALANTAVAQQPTPNKPATDKPQVITKVYDIRQLIDNYSARTGTSKILPPTRVGEAKPSPLDAGPGGGGPANPKSPPPAALSPAEEITKLVEETTAPDSWRDAGGNIGVIRIIQGMMVISQTEENHKLIQSLLSQLNEVDSRMVTVIARWVVLSPGEVEKFAQPIKQAESNAAIQGINLTSLEKISGALKYRAQITCFNGQTVQLSSGRARTVITGMTAAVGTGAAAYQPEASLVQDGISLRLTTTLPEGSSTALVDIENVISEWGGVQPSGPAPASQPMNMEAPATLDRIDIQVQQLHTTITAPVGKPILVGGMTIPSHSGKDADGKQMYLVIEVVGVK